MITLLTYEVKKDFVKAEPSIKSMKQLGFLLKNETAYQEQFKTFLENSKIFKTVEALEDGEAFLPPENESIVKKLTEEAIAFGEKEKVKVEKPKTKNSQATDAVVN